MKLKDVIQPKPNEEILMMVRESAVPHLGAFLFFAICFLIPFFFFYPLFRMGTLGVVIFFVMVVVGIFFFARVFRKWSHTLLVITDHRVIDIDQKGLFDRVVTETDFDRIEEVRYRIHGLIPSLFQYGTVFLTCKGTAADLKFDFIRRPARVQDLLNDLRHASHE